MNSSLSVFIKLFGNVLLSLLTIRLTITIRPKWQPRIQLNFWCMTLVDFLLHLGILHNCPFCMCWNDALLLLPGLEWLSSISVKRLTCAQEKPGRYLCTTLIDHYQSSSWNLHRSIFGKQCVIFEAFLF